MDEVEMQKLKNKAKKNLIKSKYGSEPLDAML